MAILDGHGERVKNGNFIQKVIERLKMATLHTSD